MKFITAISAILVCVGATPSGFLTPISTIAVPYASQYHAQDTLGQYSYGYTNHLSAKSEARSLDGSVLGSYSYIDPNGKIQSVDYTADDHGFRVAASNLPIAPLPVEVDNLALPAPVQDTPEVIEARSKHLAAVEEAKKLAAQSEINNSIEIPAARSSIAFKNGGNPVAITSSVPLVAPLVSVPYSPAVAVRTFVSPAIAVKSTPTSSAFSYSTNNFYNYIPSIQYPTFAAHFEAPQLSNQETSRDSTVIENAELAKEKSFSGEEKQEKEHSQ